MISTGSVLAGRYRLGERIGRGGMADVFRADDELLHRPVAVKVFRLDTPAGQDRRRIDAEVRILAALRHPGLVTVFDAGAVDEPGGDTAPFLVMEFIDGPTLGRRLADGPLTAELTGQLGTELSTTLAYIHGNGVVHRDIKPANILLDTESAAGAAKLTDFGIARLLDSTRITMHGMAIGTANYLSPEQATGDPAGPPADVYSLGLVLIECLTGHVAYPGSGIEAAVARLHRPPMIPTDHGPEWTRLLTAMTALSPGDRPSAADVAHTLARQPTPPGPPRPTATALLDAPEQTTPHSSPPLLGRVSRGAWLGLIAAIAAVTALLLFMASTADRSPQTPGPTAPSTSTIEPTTVDSTVVAPPAPPPTSNPDHGPKVDKNKDKGKDKNKGNNK
ncbi:protein kinase domain-containing protein [Antrihabitans stalactiti]|uniref:non-specific serine/threonine protein kinase n=1 Tax=Antrihabitans stalactiti TaxID=2584121 RepID=A0A848KFP2_9NOCA|nr:serine/threonine protein kinase [Antrihabitans stalactiti]